MKRNFKEHAVKLAVVSALVAGFAVNSYAAQNTGTFAVTADVAASCTVSGTALGFGSFDVLSGANVDATSTITATCTTGSAYTIGLNGGTTATGTVAARKMVHTNTVNLLNYTLSKVAAGGANWTDVGGASVGSGTGNGVGQNLTVFGRIPTGQTTPIVGAYSDLITATIDF